MGRNLSSALSQELANLGKDSESRKNAMKALKLYLKDLDSKAIPLFLAKVSETKNAGSSYGEYTISLYEVLARVHGPKIVSQLDNIMSTIIKTLTTSGGSFPLQQACSKVVPAIARYGIEPTTPDVKKRQIIHSLCKPLSDSLLSNQESLSYGATLCLKALVDSDNWRFASDEMVNEVCLKLAGALKDSVTQTNGHMGLVMSLAKRNCFLVEAYARLFVNSGLHILKCGFTESNSQKRLTAIQMVHSLMKCLDTRSIFSELEPIIEEMEKCQLDKLPFVKGAAFEALQTAKKLKLLTEKGLKVTDSDVISMSGSNFGRNCNNSLSSSGSRSPLSRSGSPESQTLDSFTKYGYTESPMSMCQASCNGNYKSRQSMNRKLWSENGCVDVSLKDGIFSELAREGSRSRVSSERDDDKSALTKSYGNGFQGFLTASHANGGSRSRTPSPQRANSQLNVDSIKIFTTPRKLLRSLQDDDENSDYFAEHFRERLRLNKETANISSGCKICRSESESESESVSSTEEVETPISEIVSHEKFLAPPKKSRRMIADIFVIIMCVVFAFVMWSGGNQNQGHNLVPT